MDLSLLDERIVYPKKCLSICLLPDRQLVVWFLMIVIAAAQLHYTLPQLLPLLIPFSAATLFAITWHLWGPGK